MTETVNSRGWPLRGMRADVALAALVAVVVIVPTMVARPESEISVAGWLIMAVTCASLVLRRVFPLTVTLATLAGTAAYLLMPDTDGPIVLAFAVALYTLMASGRFAAGVLIGAVVVAGSFYGEYSSDTENLGDLGVLFFVGWLLSVMAVGGAVYNRRAYLREAEERMRDAERNRDAEMQQRTTEERLRIARELHDALGHTISLIHVQAGAALHRIGKDPAQAEQALSTIKVSSQEALRELRTTLGVLRQVDEPAPTLPTPSLSRVTELVERTGSADLAIETAIDGDPPVALAPAVDVAGYRIVQEALTNVTRHSGASTAAVRIRYGADQVDVEIVDDGSGLRPGDQSDPDGLGTGIVGMRERAGSVGGQFDASPRPDGGFRVHARLPYRHPGENR